MTQLGRREEVAGRVARVIDHLATPNRTILGAPSFLFITFSGFGTGHVFKTEDYGATWEDVSIGLPDVPTNAVIVDPLFQFCSN